MGHKQVRTVMQNPLSAFQRGDQHEHVKTKHRLSVRSTDGFELTRGKNTRRLMATSSRSEASDLNEGHNEPKPAGLAQKSGRRVGTVAGCIGGVAYFLSALWLPLIFVGLTIGAASALVAKITNHDTGEAFQNSTFGTVMALPFILGGLLATVGAAITSPLWLGMRAKDSKDGHATYGVGEQFYEIAREGALAGAVCWMVFGGADNGPFKKMWGSWRDANVG